MQALIDWIRPQLNLWTLFGFFGQAMFMMRFVMQWIASERAKQSVMPEVFWYFSLGGGLILFIYTIEQKQLVFMLGQGFGLLVYIRNIYFIHKHRFIKNV